MVRLLERRLDGEGAGAASLGRLFAGMYARNLDRAIPNLIQEVRLGQPSVVPDQA